jgi:hypothetical protein
MYCFTLNLVCSGGAPRIALCATFRRFSNVPRIESAFFVSSLICTRGIICFLWSSQKVLKEKGGEITMARRTYATCVTHQFGSVPNHGLGRRSAFFFVLIIPICAFFIWNFMVRSQQRVCMIIQIQIHFKKKKNISLQDLKNDMICKALIDTFKISILKCNFKN